MVTGGDLTRYSPYLKNFLLWGKIFSEEGGPKLIRRHGTLHCLGRVSREPVGWRSCVPTHCDARMRQDEGRTLRSPVEESLNARLQEWLPACRAIAAQYARAAGCSADDILHDAVAFVIEHPERVPTDGQAPWFAAVVRVRGLHAVDRRKRQNRHERSLEELESDGRAVQQAGEKDPVLLGVHRAELVESLDSELARLPELEAATLNMRLGGATSRAIARELKLAPRVVTAVTASANERVTRSGRLRRLFDEAWMLPVVACRKVGDGARRGWRGATGLVGMNRLVAGLVLTLVAGLGLTAGLLWWQEDAGAGNSDGDHPAVGVSPAAGSERADGESTARGAGAIGTRQASPGGLQDGVAGPGSSIGAGRGAGSGPGVSEAQGAGTNAVDRNGTNPNGADPVHKIARYPDGSVWETWTEVNGLKEGLLSIFRPNGTLEQTSEMRAGVAHGWITKYGPDGEKVTGRSKIENGVRVAQK
jgi:DNA-directed RNA polymerase specialized sigma24 family protein